MAVPLATTIAQTAPAASRPAAPRRPAGGSVDRRAVAVLGFACGLLAALGPDALLLPLVAEAAPRALGLASAALLLALGWSWAARREVLGRALVLGLGAAALIGGLAAAELLPSSRRLLLSLLLAEPSLPGSLLVSLTCGLLLAPAAVPLGALLGAGLRVDDRRSLAVLCVGLAAGLGLAPHLGEMILGRTGTLRVAALCAAAAAIMLTESAPLRSGRRLPRGAYVGLIPLAALTTLCLHLAPAVIDLGANTSSWLAALMALGATVALALPLPRPASPFEALPLLALPLWLGLVPAVSSAGAPGLLADLATLALLALPLGLAAGRALAVSGAGPGAPDWTLPLALTLPAAAVLVVGLPVLGTRPVLLLLGSAWAVSSLAAVGRPALPRLAATLLLGGLIAAAPLPSAIDGLAPDAVIDSRYGVLARITDPVDGTPRLAIDGRAALGRSALSRRRLVHLPFLLRGHVERALLVASDLGQAAEAALQHQPDDLDWLRPVAAPWRAPARLAASPAGRAAREAHGNERLHLAHQRTGYDLIVLLPDPRGPARATLIGTAGFFEQSAAALEPGGLFCQWWDLASIDVTDLKGIVGGALAAFQHTYLMMDHPRSRHAALAILGCNAPLRIDPAAIDRALAARPTVAADWDAVGLDGVLTACLVSQPGGVLELLTPSERRLDDERPTLGVRAPLRALEQPATVSLAMETFAERRCNPMQWLAVPAHQRAATRAYVRDVQRGWQHLLGGAQKVVSELSLQAPPFDTEAPGQGPEVEADGFVQALASLPDWPYLERLVLDMAARLESEGRAPDAEHYLRRAVAESASSPRLRFALAQIVERQGDLDDACELYGTVLAFDPRHAGALAAVARLCGDG